MALNFIYPGPTVLGRFEIEAIEQVRGEIWQPLRVPWERCLGRIVLHDGLILHSSEVSSENSAIFLEIESLSAVVVSEERSPRSVTRSIECNRGFGPLTVQQLYRMKVWDAGENIDKQRKPRSLQAGELDPNVNRERPLGSPGLPRNKNEERTFKRIEDPRRNKKN